jgi:hypothetical protein
MGMFAFRRLRDREAASTEVASLSIAEPTPKSNSNSNPQRRGRLKQLSTEQGDAQGKTD